MVVPAPSKRLERIPLTRVQWVFLMLMVLSICINYIDRGSLSVADKFLQAEFKMDPVHRGYIYSAFFITYAGFQIVAGWLVDRFNVNRVLALGFFIWSGAMLMTGAAIGFASLFAIRLAMGMGESVAYPSYSKILAGNFREQQRGLANAAIDAGCKLGPALGLLLGGLFMDVYGWRMFFFVTGGLSLLWLIPWFMYAPKDQPLAREQSGGRMPTISEICSKRDAWGTFVGLFCTNYVWFFILTWLPGYIREELKYTQSQMAVFGSIPLWVVAGSTLLFGFLSDRWIASGASATLVRKTCTTAGLLLATVILGAPLVHDARSSLILICGATFAYGIFSSNLWAVTQTLAGPAAAGRWTGLQNYIGNLSGVLAPILTGMIVQSTGHFYGAFVVATGMLITGAICFSVVVRRVEPVHWTPPTSMTYGLGVVGALTGAVAGFLISPTIPFVAGLFALGLVVGLMIESWIWRSYLRT